MAIPNVKAGAAVTLRDVARVAGVHPATVSRALNEETRSLVNEETARRVLKAAEELGYQPNPIARGLKTNRSYTIGVLIPDLTNPLFPPILRGIEDRLETAGYTPLTANTDNDPERELLDSQTMRARQVDGIIAATARRDHRLHDALLEAGIELVLVNRRQEELPVSSATADDRMGMRLAVEHLVSLGHTRIAHLAGPLDYSTGLDRHDGFHETMRAAGLEPDPELVLVAEAFTESEGARLCGQLMAAGAAGGGFTAVAAANDLLALGCYDVFAERGVRCPDEISVVGFNDMPFAARFHPPLTTIHIPHYEIGKAAAELMLERLQDGDSQPRDIRLEPSLVVRGSTGAPAASGSTGSPAAPGSSGSPAAPARPAPRRPN
jgi:LacI family transcriptional regulator